MNKLECTTWAALVGAAAVVVNGPLALFGWGSYDEPASLPRVLLACGIVWLGACAVGLLCDGARGAVSRRGRRRRGAIPQLFPWDDVLWTHAEVVDRLPARIRDDFRPPASPLASFGLTTAEVEEALEQGWPLGELVEVRDLADPEPRFYPTIAAPRLVFTTAASLTVGDAADIAEHWRERWGAGQRGHMISDDGVTTLEVIAVHPDGTVQIGVADTRHAESADE